MLQYDRQWVTIKQNENCSESASGGFCLPEKGPIMTQAFAEVLKMSQEKKVHMRTAAYILGVGRVVNATKLRGIYP